MMKAFHVISLGPILAFSTIDCKAQAPVFSQYYSSALYLNPAMAGLEKDTYLGMNYRSQWSNLSLPFNTFQFSFIQPITKPGVRKKHLGGIGLTYYNDVAGANKEFVTQGVSLAFAHNIHLNRFGNNIISCAVQLGAGQQRINYDALRWSSQYSSFTGYDQALPGESLNNYQVFQPIVNAGMIWYFTDKKSLSNRHTSIYNGFCVSNLVRSRGYYTQSNESLNLLLKAHGGFTSTISNSVDFSPNYLVQMQNKNIQFNIGSYIGYSVTNPRGLSKAGTTKIQFGIWYRLHDAFIFSTGLSNAVWNLGFSYDSNITSLSRTVGNGSAYELSLGYRVVNRNGFKRFSSPLL
jgi:type IX secretion system PorP/SprF family membrane protein